MGNLLKDNKKLMKEYNFEKNKDIDLEKITEGSHKKIWWICSTCNNEWETVVKNRTKGTGCPNCGLKKIGINRKKSIIEKRGSLYDNRLDIAKEWNYEKNYPLTPNDVTVGSGKKVWWKCRNGHEWEARIDHRVNGSNCIYCAGQKAVEGENDISITHPNLVKEWNYRKNKNLSPQQFMAGSNKKVWWKCKNGHEWEATINHRTNGTNCPYCSSHGTSFPEQAILYYISKLTFVESRKKVDGKEIDIYLPLYNIGFEYDGMYYHSSEHSIEKEKNKDSVIRKNGITLYHIKESNQDLFDIKNNIIYCKIDRQFKYIEKVLSYIQTIIDKKIDNIDIEKDKVEIYNQYILCNMDNSFGIYYPNLLKEWNYRKNKNLSPQQFMAGSNKKVWWKCQICKSSYIASIVHRTSGTGCPYCSGKKVNETNCLAIKNPELSKYWDYNKNDLTPNDIYFRSRKKVWWICKKCSKSFQAPICSRMRAKEYECSDCMHKRIGKMNQK